MKKLIAIPVEDGKLCAHFGHCKQFAIVETNDSIIIQTEYFDPPVHQPGSYPKFLAEKGVTTLLSGGLGVKAQEIFAKNNIEIFMGLDSYQPEKLVELYLEDQLVNGSNLCDH